MHKTPSVLLCIMVLQSWLLDMELRFCKQIDKNRIDAALGLFAPSVQSTLRARSDLIIEHGGARCARGARYGGM